MSGNTGTLCENLVRVLRENGGRTAVRVGESTLSYRLLGERALRLAARIDRPVDSTGRQTVVAVMLPRSEELVVALLGILFSGASFLPICPQLPLARKTRLLEVADLCLTDAAGVATAEHTGVPVLASGDVEAVPAPRLFPHPEQAAYVLFTSGSTGSPRAVVVPHRALGAHAEAVRAAYDLQSDDRVLQFATISFDVALEEIFPTLLAGAELVLAPSSAIATGQFIEIVTRHEITVANIPTPYWDQWVRDLEHDGDVVPPSLRTLVIGSDMGRTSTLATWRRFSSIDVINAYGLTETTVTSTTHLLTDADVRSDGTALPVGRAIRGTEIVLLDENLELVAVGEPGEIYIGGHGLATGYRQDPWLTADRFIPDPFTGRAGARLYRTGDRGIVDADGVLRILGRLDNLVKIRGLRVHPQEVAQHLCTCPQVAAAHVLVETGKEGEAAQLLAYVVPADSRSVPTAGQLRAHLAKSLPSGHIPSRYVVIDALPLLANGKIDTDALPKPQLWQRADDVPFRAPATDTEIVLAELWSEVLRVDRIGVDDSFFDLGGHSLAAVQITNRVRARWDVSVTVQQLLESATISVLAATLDGAGPDTAAVFPRIERGGGDNSRVPLTAQQQQVWFLDRLSPGNIAYHAQTTMQVLGDLDLAALQRAVDGIAVRQAIFRTTFHDEDGAPFQRIHAEAPMPVRFVDISGVSEQEQRRRVEEMVVHEMTTPFDLSQLPLVRWTAMRLGPTRHEIIIVEHHLVHDGWSFGLLMRELRAAYTAEVTGTPAELPELEFQYADYASWQNRALTSSGMDRQRQHWATTLSGSPNAVSLPTTKARSGPQGFEGGMVRLEVSARTVASLRELARTHHTTLFSTMLAGFYVTLWRYTRQDDLAIGSAFANRQLAETEDVIGMFVNAVVLRCDTAGDPTFAELLRRSSDTVLAATANQEFPFVELVRTLNPDRDPTTNPYFQIMFSANDARMPDLELPGCSATVYERDNGSAKVDLNVVVIPRAEAEPGADGRFDGRITLLWEYNSELFAREFITEVADAYLRILATMAEAPELHISDVDVVGPAQRASLLGADQSPQTSPAESFAALFAATARRIPEVAAIRTTTAMLSYAQVADQARAIVKLLDESGVGAEAPVALLLQRTPRALVSLLGTLLSGRGYLPLDPAYPSDRLAFMLADSGAHGVFVDADTKDLLPAGDWEPLDVTDLVADTDTPFRPAHPAATAWVMYTSGSTGRPKGCRVTHRNLDHFVRWTLLDTPDGLFERTLAATSLCFDGSVHEIVPTLAAGGTIILVDDLFALPDLPADLVPTQTNAVGSILSELLRDREIPAGVRSVNLMGEAATAALVDRLTRARVPMIRNLYGPTETTVCVTSCTVSPEPDRAWALGDPGSGVQAYVVDPDGQLLPRGCEGELALGGEGVSDGYLGRPGLTAERFVPDRYSATPGNRLYLTGDRARWALDGRLEYLGRRDHQVKIRGLRIELGEIEQVLASHPAVSAAFVLVRGEAPAQTLVAYVRAKTAATPSAKELRAHTAQKLPSGLVPSIYIMLDEIPLTTAGKIDRARLPESVSNAFAEPNEAMVDETPWTELERTLSDIWAQVLNVPEVDRRDNLFLLGGHSLAVLRIRHRIEESIGLDVPVGTLFAYPTVAELADHLASIQPRTGASA